MAWLSVGTSNEDLIQKMVQNGVLREGPILEAFRATDRGDFVKPEDRIQAYSDRPFKKGFIHLSAPHMYVTVLKALELNAGKSFLNVGSGSGYLSCLAASLLGEEGVSHGVEISEGACQFSRDKAKEWHAKLSEARLAAGDESSVISLDGISFVNANCFDIDVLNTVNTMKYDRIYVGAGCPEFRKEFFLSMLADNGIMVVPINEKNQMLSIRKFYGRVYSLKPISNVNFAPLLDTSVRPDEEALLCELAALEGGVCLGGEIQQSILKVKAAPSSASFIIHPAPPHSSPFTSASATGNGGWQSGGSSPSSSVSSPATAGAAGPGPGPMSPLNFAGARSLNAETVVRVRLPALVWAPVHKRHLQFPPEFRRAVFTILLANNRFQTQSFSFHRSPLAYQQDFRGACMVGTHKQGCRCGAGYGAGGRLGAGSSTVGSLPHQIWLLIFSYANREWFTVPRSEVQALSMELAVERRLRRAAEDRLKRAEEARHTAEQERDMYRTALMRQKQYMGAAGAVQGPGGNIFWAMGGSGSGGEEEDEDEETEDDGDDEEGEEEGEEEEWDEEEDLGDEEQGSESDGEGEEEEEEEVEVDVEVSDGEGESEGMTVTDGGQAMLTTTATAEQDLQQDQGDEVNSISSAGFADVMEEPLPLPLPLLAEHQQEHESSDGAMAVDEPAAGGEGAAMLLHLQHSGESLPTASFSSLASNGHQHQHQHHIWFHGPDSPLTTATPWQQQHELQHQGQSELASYSFAAPLPAPITQRADLGSCSFDASGIGIGGGTGSGAQFGSLSSDLTGTTTLESASMSYDDNTSFSFPSAYPAIRLLHHRAANAATSTASTGGHGSRPPSDERISDCTAASDGYFEGEDDAEVGEEGEEEDAQFETDELL